MAGAYSMTTAPIIQCSPIVEYRSIGLNLSYQIQPCLLPYNTLTYPAVLHNTLQYHTILQYTLQYPKIPYSTLQYHIIPYNTLQYPTVSLFIPLNQKAKINIINLCLQIARNCNQNCKVTKVFLNSNFGCQKRSANTCK